MDHHSVEKQVPYLQIILYCFLKFQVLQVEWCFTTFYVKSHLKFSAKNKGPRMWLSKIHTFIFWLNCVWSSWKICGFISLQYLRFWVCITESNYCEISRILNNFRSNSFTKLWSTIWIIFRQLLYNLPLIWMEVVLFLNPLNSSRTHITNGFRVYNHLRNYMFLFVLWICESSSTIKTSTFPVSLHTGRSGSLYLTLHASACKSCQILPVHEYLPGFYLYKYVLFRCCLQK